MAKVNLWNGKGISSYAKRIYRIALWCVWTLLSRTDTNENPPTTGGTG